MLLGFAIGCEGPGPLTARAAWIQAELTADNSFWLTRSPARVEEKYARMAEDPYDWMRGTLPLFLDDALRPDLERAGTGFLVEPGATSVLIVGDPHMENLGTCLRGEEDDAGTIPQAVPLLLEWVDLDAATFGPWTLDTRRAALALALVAESRGECAECIDPVVSAFALAYADEVALRARGGAGWSPDAEAEGDGTLVAALRTEARTAGAASAALDSYTLVAPDTAGVGERLLAVDPALDEAGEGLLELGARDRAQLDRLMAAWEDGRPGDFRELDAARLYGKGVASLPATRFLVLWDRGDDGLEDDRLLNVREVLDPPSVDGELPGFGSVFADNADRVTRVHRALWSSSDADVRLAGLADGASAFKTTSTSGWFQTFDHHAIDRARELGVAELGDVQALAALVGRALASAHARGVTLNGEASLPVLAEDLRRAGGPDALLAERLRDARTDLDALHEDHQLFLDLLAERGPLLGAEVLVR